MSVFRFAQDLDISKGECCLLLQCCLLLIHTCALSGTLPCISVGSFVFPCIRVGSSISPCIRAPIEDTSPSLSVGVRNISPLYTGRRLNHCFRKLTVPERLYWSVAFKLSLDPKCFRKGGRVHAPERVIFFEAWPWLNQSDTQAPPVRDRWVVLKLRGLLVGLPK